MIIVLAALQLTSNDVHSRLTRKRNKVIRPNLQPNASDETGSTPMESMQFANNGAMVTNLSSMGIVAAAKSQVTSVFANHTSFVRDETLSKDKASVLV